MDIRDYNIKSLRNRIVLLNQEYKIYSFSIAENILMRPMVSESDRELVYDALKRVGLYEKVLTLKKGIDSFVTKEFNQDGEYLSGGELQKIALARIYAGKYDCIILDESTSSLDPVCEEEIINTIFDLFKDKTVIMISHRLATIKYVDTVVFMENGKVTEVGSHNELMNSKRSYSTFYLTQANKYDAGL